MKITGRFTIDGSDELEGGIAGISDSAVAGVRCIVPEDRLEALVLGGSYGRGEGGVLQTVGGDKAYNDLEFFVFVEGSCRMNERRFGEKLHQLASELAGRVGIDVEFKILSLRKLERSTITMGYYDLVCGGRVLHGPEDFFRTCGHHRNPGWIPRCEAARLLFNRCSGLLFSQAKLIAISFDPADAEFVFRNQAKARLGFGDAVLTMMQQYHMSCLERRTRMECLEFTQDLPCGAEIRDLHRAGVEFKLHPQEAIVSRLELLREQESLVELGAKVWLWLENQRLGREFRSAAEYIVSPVNKCPETPAWRNVAVNTVAFGIPWPEPFRYPRERLFHSMATLLWEPESEIHLFRLRRDLRTSGSGFQELVAAYKMLWERFN